MARKGGFLKGIVASAATYAVKTAVDIAANPENMQKVAQLVSEQQVGSKLKQAAASMHLPAALSPSARVAKKLDTIVRLVRLREIGRRIAPVSPQWRQAAWRLLRMG